MYKLIKYPNCELKFNYYVNENGEIWSQKTQKTMVPKIDKDGYYRVRLMLSCGKRRNFPVHRLVMMMFSPNENMMDLEVNHIDGNKFNNTIQNLEWCTTQENIAHAIRIGLRNDKGENNYFHKITENDVREIKRLYATGKYTYKALGEKFGLYKDHVSHIVRGMAWSHVN